MSSCRRIDYETDVQLYVTVNVRLLEMYET